MKKSRLLNVVKISILSLFLSLSLEAQEKCLHLFEINAVGASVAGSQASEFPQTLLSPSGVYSAGFFSYSGSLAQLNYNSAFKNYAAQSTTQSKRYFGSFNLNAQNGGGSVDLVRLTLKNSNLAYNHHDLVTLLNANQTLANKVGFYSVPDVDSIVWAPDLNQLNYRLKKISSENGITEPVWTFEKVEGVVDLEPYLDMLSRGKFPFVGRADYNLAVHDAMHGIAFAALNSTPKSSLVMKQAKKRTWLAHELFVEISTEFPQFIIPLTKRIGSLASDPMEKTMLLSIILSGNYQYYSASISLKNGKTFELQNKEVTIERVKNLLKLYSQGHVNFKYIYDKLNKSSLSASELKRLKEIFQDKIQKVEFVSETVLTQAATEIVNRFMNPAHFSDDPAVKVKQLQKGTGIDTTDPQNPVDGLISMSEDSIL